MIDTLKTASVGGGGFCVQFLDMVPEVGKVGGIIQNRDYPADFIFENLSIQLNVLSAAHKFHVKQLIFFASSCMYPKDTHQPMKENQLYTGHLEQTSIAYASAKYAGVQMCKSINEQNGFVTFIPVIPNTAYGPNDNFDLNSFSTSKPTDISGRPAYENSY